jgi:hypothetical protein
VALIAITACAGANTDALRTRAAFDLQCSNEKLALTELNSGSQGDGEGAVYGVDGCGRRATYVLTHESAWLMNTVDGKVPNTVAK